MTSESQALAVQRALAVARLRALRLALLTLHKALIDAERVRYERVNGRIEHPHAALRLLLDDPWFRWLAPLAATIVALDERLADDAPLDPKEVEGFVSRIRSLLQAADRQSSFGEEYRRSLQEVPEVVVAHGQVMKLAGEGAPPAASSPSP